MNVLEAIVYGIVQGLTEFLPVSSSGHLELTKAILGDKSVPEEGLLMTVLLHAATALSTVVIYRKEVAEIFKGLFKFEKNEETLFSFKIVLSMIPAAAVGLLFEDEIEQFFTKNVLLVGFMLLITGLLLILADRAKRTEKDLSFSNSLIIGISQALAIMPGISRSGATISTSVILGIDRTKAARFSFLMVVPLILGKMAKDVLDGAFVSASVDALPLIAGFAAAFIAGLIACQWMISLVRNSKLLYFSIYCFIIGTIAIAYTLFT